MSSSVGEPLRVGGRTNFIETITSGGQEKFQQWSSELAYADVQSLRSLIILLAEKDEKQEKIDPLKWPDFLEIVGELELATSIKNLSPVRSRYLPNSLS